MYDIIIIGAGPSGMSAALYALRANKKVLLLEKECFGGQIINASNIENYPALPNVSGYDFATNLYNQIKSLGVILKYEEVLEVTDKKEVITTKDTYKGKNIIIATGLKKRKLNLENEDKLLGSGISYCATCDGNFYKNKNVAVVGGGNTALEDALYLSNIASKVYLIHRRDNFRGEKKLISEVKEKNNIELILNSNITKIIGEDNLNSIENKQLFTIEYILSYPDNESQFVVLSAGDYKKIDVSPTDDFTIAYLDYNVFNRYYNELFGKDFNIDKAKKGNTKYDKEYVYYDNRRPGSNGVYVSMITSDKVWYKNGEYIANVKVTYSTRLADIIGVSDSTGIVTYIKNSDNAIILRSFILEK